MVLMREIQHGTSTGYTKGKCRCEECRRAHREAAARYKAKDPDGFNARRREKYAANPEPTRESTRRWRQENPDKVREYDKRKYERHRERIREYERMRYLLNREAYIARAARWKEDNRDRYNELTRTRRAANPEHTREQARKHQARQRELHPEVLKARFEAWAKSPRGRAWFAGNRFRRRNAPLTEEAMAWLESLENPLCTYCGEPADTIDHIVPIVRGGDSSRENLTPACMDCNRKKRAMSVEAFLRLLEKERDA